MAFERKSNAIERDENALLYSSHATLLQLLAFACRPRHEPLDSIFRRKKEIAVTESINAKLQQAMESLRKGVVPTRAGRKIPATLLIAMLFPCALLLGALNGPNRLTHAACALALLAIFVAAIAWWRLDGARAQRISAYLALASLVVFFGFMIFSSWAGGDALAGTIVNEHYYLASHAVKTEVSPLVFRISAALGLLLFTTWPAMFTLAFLIGSTSGRTEDR